MCVEAVLVSLALLFLPSMEALFLFLGRTLDSFLMTPEVRFGALIVIEVAYLWTRDDKSYSSTV